MASVLWDDNNTPPVKKDNVETSDEKNKIRHYSDKDGQKFFQVPEEDVEMFLQAAKSEGFEPVELSSDQVDAALYRYYSTKNGEKQFRVPVADVDTFLQSAQLEGLSVVPRRRGDLDEYNKIAQSGYSKLSDAELHRRIYILEKDRANGLSNLIKDGRKNVLEELTPLRQELARRDALKSSRDVVDSVAGEKSSIEAEEWVRQAPIDDQRQKEEDEAFERATSGDELGPIEKLKAEHKAKYGTEASTTEVVANAIVPFAKTVGDIFRNEQYEDLVKIAKGEFDIDEELRSNSTRLGYDATLYYNGVITKDELKERLMAKARGALGERAENRAIAEASIEKRGVSTWGNVASGGLQAVGMAGEFAVPGGVAVRLGVPAAAAAAGAYSDLRTERYGIGEDGSLVQEKAADSAGTAAVKAMAFGATRVAVERFGGKLLGKTFGLTVGKGLSKIGSTKIATKIANSTLGQGVGYIVNFAKSPIKLIGWDGLPEEMGEEYLEGAINTAFGLDMTESEKGDTNPFSRLSDFTGDFFKTDNLRALAQSMLLMQAWGGGAAYLRKRYNSRQASQIILQTVDGYSEKQLNKLSLEKKCEIIAQHFKGLKKSQIESIIVNGASAVNELIKSLDAYNQVGLAKKREITSDMDAQLDAKIAEYASDENIARMIKEDITANLEDNAVFSDPEAFDEMVAVSARKFEPETMRLKVHDIRGTSMNEGQKISEIENLGVTDWQSAEEAGLTEKDRFGRYTGGAVRALNVMFHGTTKLREGVKAGTVSGNLAENLLTAATCELGGRSAEERGELIDGILDRANGDEALANAMIRRLEADVDLNATVAEKLDRALTAAKAEVIKKRNPSASSDVVNGALVEPVEKPDGTITTTGEFVHGESGANTERPMPSTPLEGVEQAARLKGAELTFAPEGELKCQSFPEMRVSVSANGVALNNLSGVNIADPARSAEFAAVVAQVVNIAKRNGLQVIVKEEHKPLIQALTREIQSAGLAKTQAKLDTRSKLFSLLFKTTLGTGVTYDENSFVEALKRNSNGRRLVNNHGDIYGLVDPDGVLHFNPAVMNFNTPIHEYGHLALDAVRKINPKLWEQGKKLIKDSDYYRSIVEQSNDAENPYSWAKGNDDAICDEALATLIGDRGEKLVLDRGVDSKLKAWLKEVWKAFKGAFGLADLTDEQIEKMTLEEFVDTINAELLSGREFGTKKKLPPSEKSVKRYDEAEGSGSNGLLRWRNDRGYLFAIPVDMERTQPGGKVVFATDDANITDWIQSTLNGYDLRMSKSGKLYVKGRNGLPDELALIFGRFPTAGMNDGIMGEIASAVGNAALNEISVDDLVNALKSDRANYDAWAKAKADGKSLDEARQEEHYADEAAREEAERKAHWENSGMGILDYIRSRMEDGDPEFDLDWEIAREMANDRAESRFSVGGFHGALATGKVGLLREADKMEKAGASREEIWRTTGWWRGKDGKWRVELPDIKMRSKREIESAVKLYGNSISLGELVIAPELFKAYPALEETRIILDNDYFTSSTRGSFDPSTKDITLNGKGQISLADLPYADRDAYDTAKQKISSDDFLKNWIELSRELGIKVGTFAEEREKAKSKIEEIEKRIVEKNRERLQSLDSDETRSTLAHEIQHWIQENEVFAKGGNPKTVREARALNKSLMRDLRKALNKYGFEEWADKFTESDVFVDTVKAGQLKWPGRHFLMEHLFAESRPEKERDYIYAMLDKFESIYNENAKEAHYGYTEEDAYRSLLGEVEARNVQRRLDMSPEERAATPPWETEDVPENRQIVRFSRARVITSENGDIFKVKSKEGVKKYKTPKEALNDFIKELDGVQMTDEQQGIYDVVTGVKNTTDIRKNDLGELVKLHKGGRGKGAKKILAVHYAGKRGRVTAKEVIDMGLTIRFGRLEYDGTADHPYSHTYTATTTDGVELKVVIDLDKKGNETIINFYSDRKTENGGQRPHPVLTTASKEIVSQNAVDSQVRFSVGGIFTGSAADYANRSRQGGVDDGPSLVKIGSGEGAQVYGWGLYGSTVRGVAEGYASKIAKSERRTVKLNGEEIKENSPEVEGAVHAIKTWGSGNDPLKAAQWLESQASRMRSKIEAGGIKTKLQPIIDRNEAAAKWIRDNADKLEVKDSQEQIYEQTFFTDRAPGDESHLLKWYEPVTSEQRKWILDKLEQENLAGKTNLKRIRTEKMSGRQMYELLSGMINIGSEKAASAFLASAGIDGVKYPVDSYGGKGVKDGDKVGWNYVSFRDDNIRVDHKWTDGVARFSRGGVGPSKLGDGKQRYYEVPFAKAVDKIVKAKKPVSDEHVFISETPGAFKEIGMPALPVVMNQRHVVSCYFGKDDGVKAGNMHGLGERLKLLPKALSKPMMIIVNDSNPSSSVIAIVKMLDRDGHTVIVPVEINGIGLSTEGRITANVVKSAFGKKNLWSEKVAKALRDEAEGKVGVFYVDSNEARQISNRLAREAFDFGGTERQLLSSAKGTLHSLSDYDSPVKGVGAQIESRQFKRWFGKSKVVNRAGEPRVVYHGTPNGKFWTFDKNRVGETWGADETGFFFTSSKALAEDYTKPYFKESSADPNLFSVYLSIQNPLVIDRAWWQKNFGRSDIYRHDAVEIWDKEQRTILDAMREGGHDGVIIDPNPMALEPKMYMVPEPNQIKSATDNIGTFDKGNNDIRFHYVRGVDWSDITMDIFKFVPEGTLTAMGETEQSAAGLAGAIEKRGALRPWTKAESPADRAKPIAFDAADMVMFWRAVSGSLRNPHVQKGERIKGHPGAIGLNVGGDRIEIVSKLFGVIDESDIKKLREDCRAEGYFRNENTDWCAANDKGAIEDERLRSQAELDRRTRELYKTRVETGEGGEHYATQVLGHEIGHTLGLLPTGAKLGKAGDAMRTLYEAFESELKRQTSGLGLKRGEDNLSKEIGKLIAWWHGTETMPEYYAKPKEKFAELFGIFLTQPESVLAQAPKAYDLCVKLIAGNEKLTKAYQTITSLKWDGKSNDAVMAEVRKTWEKEAQDQYRELVKLTKESMSLKRDKFFYSLDDRFGPMFAVAKRSLKKLKQDLKDAVRNRTMSEQEATDIIKAHEDEINALQTSLYNFQRHTGGSTRLMVSMFDDVAAQAEKDGVNWNDVRDYAHYMRVIELGGRATAHAVDPARASAILDRMRQKLGDEKWLKIEKTWKAYRATYEKYVLDDPYVQELFDAETMKMLYNNKHYITMRHRMSLEEAKDWQERIEKSKKGEDNLWDPCIDIQRRLHKGLGGANGEGGGFVLYHLVGSFEATEDPLAATIRRAIEIKESAARNHLLKQMSDTLRSLGVKGVYDKVAGSKETQVDRSVYGKFYYMDSGVKHELIVPKVIHNSMSRNADDVKWFNKAFRFWKNLVTSWSPRFVSRAYRMDISSMETNIKGMHKAPVDVLSEALCFGRIGVPLYLVNDYVARFTRLSKTPFGKILWNENTANHYAYQAQQIVKIAYEGRYGERLAEARRLRDVGETSRAKEIEENVALAQEMMKLNIFQSNYNFNKQLAGFDGEEIMHQFGYRLNGKNDRKVADSLAKRLWSWSKSQARKGGRWWTRLGEEQEAVPKVIAMLYQMKKGITGEEAAATAIEYGGTPNLSRRGAHANFVEALTGAFWNVRKNASLRTIKAIKDHPTEWMVKNFAQTTMPTIVKYLMIGGVVEELIRNLFDDDEEKIKNNPIASMMYEHSRFIRESMKCVPGYMQRNYNVIPWAKYGNEVLSFRLKYSPEEFMIKRTIHGLFQAWGADPSDPSADWSDLTKELMGSVLPDVFGENPLLQMARIVAGPFTGNNPFDNFRGRYIYDPTLFEARGDNMGAMAVEMLKQLYNASPLNQLGRFSDGQDRNVDYSDMPKWLDAIVNGPVVSLIPGAYLSITSDDSYIRALADIDNRQKANARIVAGDLLAECIENGRLGGFEEGLKDLPPELKRLAIRYVLNGWRQFHMDPNAKKLRAMRRIKDPNLKRKARKWIEDAEKYGD